MSAFTRFVLCLAVAHVALSRRVDKNIDLARGYDLETYVTRPDIRAPRWHVKKHFPDRIAPGYWFVSPYADISGLSDRLEYIPYQVGPYIYDGDGNLVWSGADVDSNRNAFDFRSYQVNNETFLSYTLNVVFDRSINNNSGMHIMMDSSYNKINELAAVGRSRNGINPHEFTIFDNGARALHFGTNDVTINDTAAANLHLAAGRYEENCVVQTHIASGRKEFEWCGLENGLSPTESFDVKGNPNMRFPWDYLHSNSIDRFASGDYLFSARYANTVYKVSQADKSILWRLGGKKSDFVMNFNFSSQHHARILSENSTTTIMTLLNNAAETEGKQNATDTASSALMIALYTTEQPMRAALLERWMRPDRKLTRARGNVEMLPNGNIFIGWSENCYQTEHTPDGKMALEARLTSTRFSTYRSYKLPFVGKPTKPPIMKAFQYGNNDDGFTNAFVSWNGATEVRKWVFMGIPVDSPNWVEIAVVNKTGFESMLTSSGLWSHMSAIAFDSQGNRIGSSDIITPESTNTVYVARTPHSGVRSSLLKSPTVQTMTSFSLWHLLAGAVLCLMIVPGLACAALTVYRRAQRRGQFSGIMVSACTQNAESDVPLLYTDVEKRSD